MNNDLENKRIRGAIEELRSENASTAARDRTLDAMLQPRRSLRMAPVISTAVAAGLLAVILWPHQKAMAWSSVVQSTLANQRIHVLSFEKVPKQKNWRPSSEQWIDSPKFSMHAKLTLDGNHAPLVFDSRYDGRRSSWLDWTGFWIVMNSSSRPLPFRQLSHYTLEELLASPRIKVDKIPKEVEIDGVKLLEYDAQCFEGPEKFKFSTPVKYFVQKGSQRVVRTEMYGGANKELTEYSTIDYPATIPDERFTPPNDGLHIYDVDRDGEILKQTMAKGVPFGKGNVLRAVVQSPNGDLVVLWTGTPPNGDGSPAPSIAGYKTKRVEAPYPLTVSHWRAPETGQYLFKGQRLWGLILHLDKPVGDKVSVQLPILAPNKSAPERDRKGIVHAYRSKQVGTTTVRDFPVIHTIPFTVMDRIKGFHS